MDRLQDELQYVHNHCDEKNLLGNLDAYNEKLYEVEHQRYQYVFDLQKFLLMLPQRKIQKEQIIIIISVYSPSETLFKELYTVYKQYLWNLSLGNKNPKLIFLDLSKIILYKK